MRIVLEEWGRETVSAALDFFDLLNSGETGQSGFISD